MVRKKIAFVVMDSDTPFDSRSWSGTSQSSYYQLKKHFDVEVVHIPYPSWFRIVKVLPYIYCRLSGKTYPYPSYQKILSKYNSIKFDKSLSKYGDKIHAVFAVRMWDFLSDSKTTLPIIYYHDAVYSILLNYYFHNVPEYFIKEGHRTQKNALNKSSAIILSSNWAKEGALRDYNTPCNKIHVVQFGANHACQIKPPMRSCEDKVIHLLFVGIDWKRKGLEIAVECVNTLNALNDGKRYTLDVIGCSSSGYQSTDTITIHKFISDSEVENHYQKSHIFILPTRAECSAIVFCEAASYGLPTITYNTGGTADYIVDGETGYTLPLTSTGADFASRIHDLIHNQEEYKHMSKKARQRYETTLNWDTWGIKVADIINNILPVK